MPTPRSPSRTRPGASPKSACGQLLQTFQPLGAHEEWRAARGGVGEVTYATMNYDRYWMSVVGTLAAFACFPGWGRARLRVWGSAA